MYKNMLCLCSMQGPMSLILHSTKEIEFFFHFKGTKKHYQFSTTFKGSIKTIKFKNYHQYILSGIHLVLYDIIFASPSGLWVRCSVLKFPLFISVLFFSADQFFFYIRDISFIFQICNWQQNLARRCLSGIKS